MKKFLKNYDFEDNFDFTILSRGKSYYRENRILDIWCQDDGITAYIDGSEIYRVELRANDNELNNFYIIFIFFARIQKTESICVNILQQFFIISKKMIFQN